MIEPVWKNLNSENEYDSNISEYQLYFSGSWTAFITRSPDLMALPCPPGKAEKSELAENFSMMLFIHLGRFNYYFLRLPAKKSSANFKRSGE